MSVLRPDARVRKILADTRAAGASCEGLPDDPTDRALFLAAHPDPSEPIDTNAVDALDIYQSPYHHVLDALILARAPDSEICQALHLPAEVLQIYRAACFDISVFRHAFAIRHYVRTLPDDPSEERKSYDLALTEGYDALLDRYRIGEWGELDPKRATMQLAREFLLRSREHRGLGLTNAVAKESLKAARAALDACGQLYTITRNKGLLTADDELRIALSHQELTVSVEQAPVPVMELVRTGPATPKTD